MVRSAMDRTILWPDFDPKRVIYEDDDLLVVDKPAGVPSQAADPERPDDVVTRLRRPYLGVHQRLDRDTSGVLLFTKRPEANAGIAKQFEGRRVAKRYLAAVRGWRRGSRATLDDLLAKGEDGAMTVVRRGGQRAVTQVSVREKSGDRVLLDVELETGRTHQARVQLAHAGAPIAGDAIYEGPPAPRLMLHAAELEVIHPRTQKKLTLRAPVPRAFAAWMKSGDRGHAIYDDAAALDDALALAAERRWGLGRGAETTAFRLANEEGDALPGLAVDVYGDHAVVQIHLSPIWDDLARRERVLDRVAALGFDGVYVKLRPRQANVLVETRREDVAPAKAVRGSSAPEVFTILEEGIPFPVRLGDGLSTGIFLDQRKNRVLVRSLARGARVANLFAYTCAFSVAAAHGGAAKTTSVDASVVALERGREAFGPLLGPQHSFAAEDAFAWLARTAKKNETYDLVVLDPPSYSSTRKRRFVAESDYGELFALAAAVAAPGAKILACCNHRGVPRGKLRRMIHEGARAAKRELSQLKDLPDSPDFPPPPGREPYMKSLLATFAK